MLARESLAIGEEVGRVDGARARGGGYAPDGLPHVRHDLQRDAGAAGRRASSCSTEPLDVMVVIGGLQLEQHDLAGGALRGDGPDVPHRGRRRHRSRRGHDPPPPLGREGGDGNPGLAARAGPVRVGLTAGASTPNNKIGEAVGRIFATRGIDPKTIL